MKFLSTLLGTLFAVSLCAQTVQDPLVTLAQQEVEKIQGLVDSGVLPQARLDKARADFADAQDEASLRETLFGSNLTAGQCEEMIAVTERLVARRQHAVDELQKLLDSGVIARVDLSKAQEELDLANRQHTLALSRATSVKNLADMAHAEDLLLRQLESERAGGLKNFSRGVEHYGGNGIFTPREFGIIEAAFQKRFARVLPISAMGETDVHRGLGFDHRGRVDVAVMPDDPEGIWLRNFLTQHKIPYFAFRSAVPHQATGAHIHIGPASTRLLIAD